jgi:uncharacterized coiled-coil protein SlyX
MASKILEIPTAEPLLDRLDRIEARMSAMEASSQESILGTAIGPSIDELRTRLHAETRESLDAALTTFEETIDNLVSLRISTLEKTLIDQSTIITTLSRRAIESDANLQRLISAVERLCDRTDSRVAPAAAAPNTAPNAPPVPFFKLPFEKQLSEAIQRQPESPPRPPDSGFRPRIVKEEEGKRRRRTPLTRL